MSRLIAGVVELHHRVFATVESLLRGWFLGLLARFSFAAVLYVYFLNSAKTKVGDGPLGFFSVSDSAYYQILLPVVEAHGGDVSRVAFVPWGLIVWAGTYAEFILPLLVVIGLFTRLAALGMVVFVLVQSYVDITAHGVGAETAGMWFDRFSDGLIADQRLMWVFLLAYLAVKGPGLVSVDALLARLWPRRQPAVANERPLT